MNCRGTVLVLIAAAIGSWIPATGFATDADHLILSEINWSDTRGAGSPCIKIVNPTVNSVPMEDVYLTDATLSPNVVYYNIPHADPENHNPGGSADQDFHVRFPRGYEMAAGDTIVIALNGSDEYAAKYDGAMPDFELVEDALSADEIPEMVAAFPGSINIELGGSAVLDMVAESLILYTWTEGEDLVQDLDYLFWGANSSFQIDKSGVTVGSSTYLDDTPTGDQVAARTDAVVAGYALRRNDADEGDEETDDGPGNGVTGHDETGEVLSASFSYVLGLLLPAGPGDNLFASAPVVEESETSPPAAYAPTTVSLTLDSYSTVTGIILNFSFDGIDQTPVVDDMPVVVSGVWTGEIPGVPGGTVVDWYCVVANLDGGIASYPVSAPLYTNTYTVMGSGGGEDAEKLLITEVSAGPNFYNAGWAGMEDNASEFIEIHNPNDVDVDLSDYYLTDSVNYAFDADQVYYRIALGPPHTYDHVGGGNYNDFHARFPAGYVIEADGTIVIAVAGSDWFFSVFNAQPDLELYEDGASADDIPDMRPVFLNDEGGDSIYTPDRTAGSDGMPRGIPELEEYYGEPVILYFWDGESDLVTDIDVLQFGAEKTGEFRQGFDKTDITIGSSMYQPDTPVDSQDWFVDLVPDGSMSYHRVSHTEGEQTTAGGNGVDGRDETSEDMSVTWAAQSFSPGSYPLGGDPVVGDSAEKLLITEVNAGMNCYPYTGIECLAMEFIEIYNPNDFTVQLDDYYLTDAISHFFVEQLYWQIAWEGEPTWETVGGGNYNDFTARFPEGSDIEQGEVLTIAMVGSSAFFDFYGILPDLEMYEDDVVPDDIPDMRPVFLNDEGGDSIYTPDRPAGSDGMPRGIPEFEEYYGEPVILYHWEEGADLVTDIDFFVWGDDKTSTYRYSFDKTGVTVGASTYKPDTPVVEQDWYVEAEMTGLSYCRVDSLEGVQPVAAGNGVDGRDETGEDLTNTFEVLAPSPGEFGATTTDPDPEGEWQNMASGPLADSADNVAHAWGDFDRDGDQDLYLVRNTTLVPNTLLENRGGMTFQATILGLEDSGEGADAAWGDANNDGYLELFVANGDGANRVFWPLRSYDGQLLGYMPDESGNLATEYATAAVDWIDYDEDGWIEAYVSNRDGPNQMHLGRYDFLNLVPEGLAFSGTTGACQWCDFDGDHDVDLGLITDPGRADLLAQSADRTFQDLVLDLDATGSGCTWADFDNDGDFDLFVASSGAPNALYENLGPGGFQVVADPAFDPVETSLSGIWGDYDNDGYCDLYVVNAFESNRLMHNDGGTGQFTVVQDSLFIVNTNSMCATWSDIEGDGDLDLYVSNLGTSNQLIRNNLDNENNWLTVRLEGHPWRSLTNRCAIGAVIRVDTELGSQWRFISSGSGHAGQAPFEQHFGLGAASVVTKLTVYWPYMFPWGRRHTAVLSNVAANQRLEITEEMIASTPVTEGEDVPLAFRLGSSYPNPFNPTTVVPFDLPARAAVDVRVYDLRGRLTRHLLDREPMPAGRHSMTWNGTDDAGRAVAAGVYLLRLEAGAFSDVTRMVLIK